MDVSNVSSSSMALEGSKLIADLWDQITDLDRRIAKGVSKDRGVVVVNCTGIKDLMILAVHRLAFLEMVTKGLNYMEMHDAQAYAKFVEGKCKIEDMDIEEIRVLLR